MCGGWRAGEWTPPAVSMYNDDGGDALVDDVGREERTDEMYDDTDETSESLVLGKGCERVSSSLRRRGQTDEVGSENRGEVRRHGLAIRVQVLRFDH